MLPHRQVTSQLRKQVEELLSQTYHTSVSLKQPAFMPDRPNVCRYYGQQITGSLAYFYARTALFSTI